MCACLQAFSFASAYSRFATCDFIIHFISDQDSVPYFVFLPQGCSPWRRSQFLILDVYTKKGVLCVFDKSNCMPIKIITLRFFKSSTNIFICHPARNSNTCMSKNLTFPVYLFDLSWPLYLSFIRAFRYFWLTPFSINCPFPATLIFYMLLITSLLFLFHFSKPHKLFPLTPAPDRVQYNQYYYY